MKEVVPELKSDCLIQLSSLGAQSCLVGLHVLSALDVGNLLTVVPSEFLSVSTDIQARFCASWRHLLHYRNLVAQQGFCCFVDPVFFRAVEDYHQQFLVHHGH
jgi:hypothetical protein